MTRFFVLVGALLACAITALFLPGCKNLPTAQQQFEDLCPIVTADLQTLSVSPLLNATAQASALKAHDLNVQICANVATVNVADVKDFANTALPAISAVVAAIPPTPQFPSTAIALALNTFGPLALQLVEQTVSTVQGASASAAASAPVAASQ
jgi:hypothetical protein